MRAYKGRKNIFIKKALACVLILGVVFVTAYLGVTKIIDIPFDKIFQKQENSNVVVNNQQNSNTNANTNTILNVKNMTTMYIVFDNNSSKTAANQLADFIKTLDKTYINTIGFDINYMQIGKNESKDFDIQQLVKIASDAGFATVMRVDTLSLPKQSDISWKYAVLTKNNVTWLDRNNEMWLNPYATDGTGEVIKQYCEAAKKYGFNVLELSRLGFFMEGRLELVNFGDNDSIQNRSNALIALVKTAKDSLKDSNVKIGLSLDTLSLLDTKKASVGQNSSDIAQQADILIPYISVSDILENKDVLTVLKLDEKADATTIYKSVIEKLGLDKTKLMPCVDISSNKDSTLATKDFIKKIVDSQKDLNMYGVEFNNSSGVYKTDNFKKS